MNIEEINTVGIVGAGTMGSGIAHLASIAGYNVILYDISPDVITKSKQTIEKQLSGAVERGKISRETADQAYRKINFSDNFDDLHAEIIVEAVLEKHDLKIDILKRLASQNEPSTILATNTSSIPITSIAAQISNPERVIGMHFFNPAHIMKLVEVISGAQTSEPVASLIVQLAEKMGKNAARVNDSPGFIVNRVARHYYVESLLILEERIASFEAIDKLLEASGFRLGPFKLMDLIGVDTNLSVTESVYKGFNYDSKFKPSRLQQQLSAAGFRGKKSGRGFYTYNKD